MLLYSVEGEGYKDSLNRFLSPIWKLTQWEFIFVIYFNSP